MARLQEKVALITGGTGGIGLAAARLFAAEGAKLALVDLDAPALDAAVAEIGREHAIGIPADVTQPDAVEGYVAATVERYGRIDAFFNNAGIEGAVQPITDYPLETFDQVMSVNVRGAWLGLKRVIPVMAERGGGSIVITSSVAGLRGVPRLSAYVASKHAVVGLMRAAALECAPLGIRVNTINPAPIATRMLDAIGDGFAPGAGDTIVEKMAKSVPLRRCGEPEEVARLALYLLSDESGYCTGGVYPVDGGTTAG